MADFDVPFPSYPSSVTTVHNHYSYYAADGEMDAVVKRLDAVGVNMSEDMLALRQAINVQVASMRNEMAGLSSLFSVRETKMATLLETFGAELLEIKKIKPMIQTLQTMYESKLVEAQAQLAAVQPQLAAAQEQLASALANDASDAEKIAAAQAAADSYKAAADASQAALTGVEASIEELKAERLAIMAAASAGTVGASEPAPVDPETSEPVIEVPVEEVVETVNANPETPNAEVPVVEEVAVPVEGETAPVEETAETEETATEEAPVAVEGETVNETPAGTAPASVAPNA